MNFLHVFAHNLLPVFLCAGTGYALAATLRPEPRSVSHVGFYVFSPCLVFQLILANDLGAGALLRMVGFGIVVLLSLALVAVLVGRALRWSRPLLSAVVLVILLPNAGNFGLSASLLAFGQEGMAQASLFFVTSAVLSFTLGVFVASLGRTSFRKTCTGLWRVPAIWAVLVALGMSHFGWKLPTPLDATVSLLAQGTIPLFLVILGLQLHATRWKGQRLPLVFVVGMRLAGGALLALALAPLFELTGVARQAAVLQAAMPSAVICTILATEYDVEPGLVTTAVFFSTLLCPLILTPLLVHLGA
jgi:predicted permease